MASVYEIVTAKVLAAAGAGEVSGELSEVASVTDSGLRSTHDYCWGANGSRWANEVQS